LKFEYIKKDNTFEITIPVLRLDLTIPEDLIDEVVRIIGYDKIEAKIPKLDFKPQVNGIFYKTLAVKKHFIDAGYSEVMTYTFCNEGDVGVLKSTSDKNFLRTELRNGLKEVYTKNSLNEQLLALDKIKIFEIGTVFLKNKEEIRVGWHDNKGPVEMTLDEFCEENNIVVGDSYIDLLQTEDKGIENKFKSWSSYPFITRDIAVWVPEGTPSDNLKKIYKNNGTDLLVREPRLVDTFTKDGKTSYAFRLVFQAFDRTLTDTEINEIMEKITEKILSNTGWEVR